MQRRRFVLRARVLAGAFLLGVVAAAPDARADGPHPQSDAGAPDGPEEDALLESIGPGPWDPIERVNRISFWINRGVEAALLDPLSQLYGWAVPDPAKRCVRRVFTNLNSGVVLMNDLMQIQGEDAVTTTFRFALNSTIGLGGLFDPAQELGLRGHESDFGETLHVFGMPPGPYVFLPILGPAMARDAIGRAVDGFMRPQFYLLGPLERLTVEATDGLTLRERHLDALRALRESSLDYYSAFRGAYVMSREAELRRRAEASAASRSAVGGDTKLGAWAWSQQVDRATEDAAVLVPPARAGAGASSMPAR